MLAAHGWEPDRDAVRRALGDRPHQVLSFDESTFFGDVLTAAARAASSEVLLKVDDDDWYSPDAVHDLLMARRFSGADVVGMPSEFVYLQRDDVTVRRNHPSEIFARFVAGGTLLMDRSLLRSLGDFRRVRKYVDARLLAGSRRPVAGSTAPTGSATSCGAPATATRGSATTRSSAGLTSWSPSGAASGRAWRWRSTTSTGRTGCAVDGPTARGAPQRLGRPQPADPR